MNVLIWGSGSQSKLAIAMLKELHPEASVVGVYDKWSRSERSILGHPVLTSQAAFADLLQNATHYYVGIGAHHNYARVQTANYLGRTLKPLSLIHQHSFIDAPQAIGTGNIVMPGVVVNKFCSLGSNIILNTNATVDHECVIQDGTHIMGGASIAGRVKIRPYATVGTNATILPDLTIGENAFVGAGSVVTRDVPDNTTVIGNPARFHDVNELFFDESTLPVLKHADKSSRD